MFLALKKFSNNTDIQLWAKSDAEYFTMIGFVIQTQIQDAYRRAIDDFVRYLRVKIFFFNN